MKIENFIIGVSNGQVFCEMSERDILQKAQTILWRRLIAFVPAEFEECEFVIAAYPGGDVVVTNDGRDPGYGEGTLVTRSPEAVALLRAYESLDAPAGVIK